MRLINVRTGRLEEFFHEPPAYAALSHTWGSDDEEISFRDLQEGNDFFKTGVGRDKFAGCCKQALADGLDYAWMDTCCIDKANSTELSEAINSMFAWYQKAAICYAFLADVSAADDVSNPDSEFRQSRWFERGWTLQELLAPGVVRFYSCEWSFLGTKRQLSTVVAQITGIPRPFLLGTAELREASVAQRMSWAAKRVTKRKEDIAYCLLGMFGVTMPMIYGEGEQAFGRLQEEIMRRNTDDSILAWNLSSSEAETDLTPTVKINSGGILASSPSDFANSGDIVCREHRGTSIDPLYVFGGHLRIHLCLYTTTMNQTFGLLDCHPKDDAQAVVGIPLFGVNSDGSSEEYIRPEGHVGKLLRSIDSKDPPKLIRICKDRQNESVATLNRRYGFYIEESVHETGLEMIEVEPKSRWERDNATINTTVDFNHDQAQRTWVRFRQKREEVRDYVVMLELEVNQSRVQARCHVMTASQDTSLDTIAAKIMETNQHTFGKQSASNGVSNLLVTLDEERVGACQMFVVRLASMSKPPRVSVNVTLELAQLERQVYLRDLLYEDRDIGPERSQIGLQIREKTYNADIHRKKLAAVQSQLDKLQLEKQSLNKGLTEATREIEQLHAQDRILKQRRGTLSQAVTITQDILGRLDEESVSQWHEAMVGSLLQSLSPIGNNAFDSLNDASEKLFMQAVLKGHEATVQFLLDRGSDIESHDNEGHSLLSIAAIRGHEGLIQMLAERGADIESVNQHGSTPLLIAALQGNAPVVGLLLDLGAGIEVKTRNGQTSLGIAALKGHRDVARLLIDRGANIESTNADGWRPLHVAIAKGHKDLTNLLLSRGAEIEPCTRRGITPLAMAAMKGNEGLAHSLIQKGATIDTRDADGWTPLFHATSRGCGPIMDLLLDKGADIKAKDIKGLSLLSMALEKGQKSAAMLLIDRGASEERMDSKGKLFQQAIKGNHEAFVQLLRRNGGSSDSLDSGRRMFWRKPASKLQKAQASEN